jgi:hypothetical protein
MGQFLARNVGTKVGPELTGQCTSYFPVQNT